MVERKHIQVFGTVQGVGFRFYTQKIANQHDIKGTVQNVDDYVDICTGRYRKFRSIY